MNLANMTQAERRAVERAAALYEAAEEYPRCLQDWPATAEERQADMLLRLVGGENALAMPARIV